MLASMANESLIAGIEQPVVTRIGTLPSLNLPLLEFRWSELFSTSLLPLTLLVLAIDLLFVLMLYRNYRASNEAFIRKTAVRARAPTLLVGWGG